jgi:REP element-mobilizing transposase RayT
VDAFIVMPDHVHGILCFADARVTADRPRRFGDAVPRSLSTILGTYKAEVTKRINAQRGTPGLKVWQRNYYEHVVRSRAELARIRWYIMTNPVRWNRQNRWTPGLETRGDRRGNM